jgi:hypothetical protein
MPKYDDFGHLPIPLVLRGRPKLFGGGSSSSATYSNRQNRANHGGYMKRRSTELSRFWLERTQERKDQGLPQIKSGIPILLEIDPNANVEFLRGLGFEIVAELQEGFIIVASDDVDLELFNNKVNDFIANIKQKCNSPAQIYALCEETDRLKTILSPQLYIDWASINETNVYYVDLGVSCSGGIMPPSQPTKENNETEEHYQGRLSKWRQKSAEAYMAWDEIKGEREQTIESFVTAYNGEILDYIDGSSDLTGLPDSFSARLKINGKCLKDLALNFAYIFEMSLSAEVTAPISSANNHHIDVEIKLIPPSTDSPKICVIDSGVQEKHQYIAPAILQDDSICLLPGETNTFDCVRQGGHGTRVTGAILYPDVVPRSGVYSLPCWIRNIRVLDQDSRMPMDLFPPKMIKSIVQEYHNSKQNPSKIFNQSIGCGSPCELKHMSSWAAEIDYQSYLNDILFIQSSGNIQEDTIKAYIQAGFSYPSYLHRELSRICEPAESLQAITVGSIAMNDYETDDTIALGQKDQPSAFSRSGPGIWDVVKPDVVEYGGTEVINKTGAHLALTTPEDVCPELIRRSPEGPAYAKDAVGTSFAAPKVTYIASQIEKTLPNAPALLYRALIAQSAHWPEWAILSGKDQYSNILRTIGFGIPDVIRATQNNEYRITFITDSKLEIGEGEAHIFRVPIPEELSTVGDDFNILVEITLSYAANPRRTRREVKSYLSTWLDWCCSRIGEDYDTFARRVFETGGSIDDDGDFEWVIGDAINRGFCDNFSRKNGTLQKDWTVIKSNQLSDAFCIAVRGHKGWGSFFKAKYSLAVSFEAVDQDIPIYESIRSMIEVEVENEEIQVQFQT